MCGFVFQKKRAEKSQLKSLMLLTYSVVSFRTRRFTCSYYVTEGELQGSGSEYTLVVPGDHCYLLMKSATVTYADAQGKNIDTKNCHPVSWYDNDMNAGWNAVVGEVNFEGRLVVKGDANLILCDGSELIVPDGITVSKGSSLTIWQQSGKNGKLTASASESHYAGIGGYDDQDTGSITINGGVINAKAVYDAAAIGGGYGGSAGKTTINGGDVTAQGGGLSAAIGSGGGYGSGGEGTINGGKIKAIGGTGGVGGAAGIGASHHSGKTAPGKTLTININGGEIDAQGGNFASGIGGGSNRYCEIAINISGGTINAKGGMLGAGIGGGRAGTGGAITITGGDITATPGSDDTQAIGRGANATESGTLNLGDSEHYLKVGTVSDDEVSYADADKRVSTAQSHNTVRVVPCTEHTYGEDGVCTLCGYQTTAYLITFVDEDGKTVLQQSKYMVDLTPKYKGKTPFKRPDAQNTYEFAGWTPEIAKATADATYKATYKALARKLPIGDANGDGKVTIDDATMIQKFVAELVELTPDQFIAADTNCDGIVNIDDATMIQKYIAELIDHLG